MKKWLCFFLFMMLIIPRIDSLTNQSNPDDTIRRPFIPGREQNLF